MSVKLFILLPLLLSFITPLASEPVPVTEDEALLTMLMALKTGSRAYSANEAYLKGGKLQWDASMSSYYFQLDGGIDTSGKNSFSSRTSDGSEINNNYSFSAGPELSFSRLLSSGGTLSGSLSDSISGSGIEQSDSLILPQQDIEFQNDLSLSIAYSQPLYFGDAYDSSLAQIDSTLAISEANYMNNRNILVISTVQDYYNLITAKYRLDLINVRLETNTESLRRMEKEFQLGIWTAGQLNTAKAASLQAEADSLKARQTLISTSELLVSVYGLDEKQLPELSGSSSAGADIPEIRLIDFTDEQMLSRLSSNNPDLKISLSRIAAAEAAVIIQENDSAMILSAGGGYNISNGLSEDTFSDSFSLSLNLSSSVLDGGTAQSAAALKNNELQRLRNEFEDSRKRTVSQLKILFDSIILSGKLSEIYSLQEETGRLEYNKGLKEFELGGITQKDLLDLQIDLENTRLSVLLNRIDKNLAVLELYQLLGYDLESMLLSGLNNNVETE